MAPATGHREGAVIPAPVGGEQVPVGAAAPDGGGQERTETGAGYAQRRTGCALVAGAFGGDRRAAHAAPEAARSAGAEVLRRPLRGTDRQHNGDQPGRGQEPHRQGRGSTAGRPGVGNVTWFRGAGSGLERE